MQAVSLSLQEAVLLRTDVTDRPVRRFLCPEPDRKGRRSYGHGLTVTRKTFGKIRKFFGNFWNVFWKFGT